MIQIQIGIDVDNQFSSRYELQVLFKVENDAYGLGGVEEQPQSDPPSSEFSTFLGQFLKLKNDRFLRVDMGL